MGSSVCRALRHSGRGDEPGMASQAGSTVSEILDRANIPRGIEINLTMPPCRGGLSVGPRRRAATEPEFLDPVGVENLADENLRIVADGQVMGPNQITRPVAVAAPARDHLAFKRHDQEAAARLGRILVAAVDHVEAPIAGYIEGPGPADAGARNLAQEAAVSVEDLNARIAPVGDVEVAPRVDGDAVGDVVPAGPVAATATAAAMSERLIICASLPYVSLRKGSFHPGSPRRALPSAEEGRTVAC